MLAGHSVLVVGFHLEPLVALELVERHPAEAPRGQIAQRVLAELAVAEEVALVDDRLGRDHGLLLIGLVLVGFDGAARAEDRSGCLGGDVVQEQKFDHGILRSQVPMPALAKATAKTPSNWLV